MRRFYNTIVLLFFYGFSFSQGLSPGTTNSFIFSPPQPLERPPIEVFYHIPSGDISSMPILFSFHGASRNADDYRDFWINMANENEFMVFAPEFSSSNYPGLGDNYLMGNVFEDGDNPVAGELNSPNHWTFSVIEPLFEYIKLDISGTQESYNAWGHSGGAQFLHRFAMFVPQSNLGIGICSNAGWYTVPEDNINYPYGIGLPFGSTNLNVFDFLQNSFDGLNINSQEFFQKNLLIHLGTNDNDPDSSGLRHNSVVDNQQGLNRYDRGHYFFETSQNEAQFLNSQFNWLQFDAEGISHNGQLMANDALQYLINPPLNTPLHQIKTKLFPNPVKDFLHLNSTIPIRIIEVFNSVGQLIFRFEPRKNYLDIDMSLLLDGMYTIKIITENGIQNLLILKNS